MLCLAALCLLAGVQLCANEREPALAPADSPWELAFSKTFPFGVAKVGEKGEYTLTVTSRTDKTLSGTVNMDIQVPGEAVEKTQSWSVSLGPGGSKSLTWVPSTDAPGYVVLTVVARDAEGKELGRTTSGLLVVAPHLSEPLPAEESFFRGDVYQRR